MKEDVVYRSVDGKDLSAHACFVEDAPDPAPVLVPIRWLSRLSGRGPGCSDRGVATLAPDLRRREAHALWRRGRAPDVEYLGSIDHDGLLALLDRSRIACLPLYREGLPILVLEAMGRWNCVISTRVGGAPVALDGAGMLIEPGNEAALAAAAAPGESEKHARRARARIVSAHSKAVVFPIVEAHWLDTRRGVGDRPKPATRS